VAIELGINRENEDNWIDLIWDAWPTNQVSLWIPEVWGFMHDQDRLWVRKPVGWTQKGHALQVGPCLESHGNFSFTWEARLTVDKDTVRIDLQVENSGDTDLPAMFNINGCLNFVKAPDFMDSSGQCTYVRVDGHWQDMAAIRRPQALNLGGDHYHLLVKGRDDPMDVELLPNVHVTSSLCARVGRTGECCIGWAWDTALRLDINFNHLQCMHSVPALGPIPAGHTVQHTGKIYFHQGDKGGLLDFCRRDGLV